MAARASLAQLYGGVSAHEDERGSVASDLVSVKGDVSPPPDGPLMDVFQLKPGTPSRLLDTAVAGYPLHPDSPASWLNLCFPPSATS